MCPQITLEMIENRFNAAYRHRFVNERLLIPVDELRRLKEIAPMAIVTGRPRDDAHHFIKRFKLQCIFDLVVCMEDTEQQKPNPAPLLFVS